MIKRVLGRYRICIERESGRKVLLDYATAVLAQAAIERVKSTGLFLGKPAKIAAFLLLLALSGCQGTGRYYAEVRHADKPEIIAGISGDFRY